MTPVVVGAGPAGIRAVERLVAAGLRPAWIDEAPDGGGRIYQRPPAGFRRSAAELYGADARRAAAVHAALEALKPRTDWRPETLVWNLHPTERRLDLMRQGQRDALHYDALILCTGAMERILPLPGWTLPGVTGLGAAQIALKAQGCAIGSRVAFIGTGPLLWLVAWQYAKAGAPPALVLDTTAFATKLRAAPGLLWNIPTTLRGLSYIARLRRLGIPIAGGAVPLAIEGEGTVAALCWRDAEGVEHRTTCDAIGMGWGLKPEAQLADLAGIPFRFDATQHNWVPQKDATGRTPLPGIYLAGDGASIGGAVVAELAGARAAMALLEDAGQPVDFADTTALDRRLRAEARFRAALERAFPWPAHLARAMADSTPLCRCEMVTAGDLRAAARSSAATLPAPEVNRAKALTRLGMGRCQGRLCAPAAAEVLAGALGCSLQQAGRLRGQPPVKPIPVPEVAA